MAAPFSRVLAFFAHPDDETLACGGTLARWAEDGSDIFVAIPGTGVLARRSAPEGSSAGDLKGIREDCRKAMGILGVDPDKIQFGNFPDNAMDSRPILELIQWLEDVLERVRPELVLTHHRFCSNVDHRQCHEAAVIATRPVPGRRIVLWSGEVSSSTGYLRPARWEPNQYVELKEKHLDQKVRAMEAYGAEVRADPHPRSPEVLKALAKVRGSEAGFFLAESFIVQKSFM